MKWLNIAIETLTSEDYLGCEPLDRATWLNLMAYCARQETGGVIVGARSWGDRKWAQLCGLFRAEVMRECPLWTWDGDDLVVRYYPIAQEETVKSQREAGRTHGRGQSSSAKSKKSEPADKDFPAKYTELKDYWNDTVKAIFKQCRAQLPACTKITPKRAKMLHARFREDKAYGDVFKTACDVLQYSDFHLGNNDRNWTANFDYMIRPDTVTKLIEQYAKRAKTTKNTSVWVRSGTNEYQCPFCYRPEPVHLFEDKTGQAAPIYRCLACGRVFSRDTNLLPFPSEEKPHRFDPEYDDDMDSLPENPTDAEIAARAEQLRKSYETDKNIEAYPK